MWSTTTVADEYRRSQNGLIISLGPVLYCSQVGIESSSELGSGLECESSIEMESSTELESNTELDFKNLRLDSFSERNVPRHQSDSYDRESDACGQKCAQLLMAIKQTVLQNIKKFLKNPLRFLI